MRFIVAINLSGAFALLIEGTSNGRSHCEVCPIQYPCSGHLELLQLCFSPHGFSRKGKPDQAICLRRTSGSIKAILVLSPSKFFSSKLIAMPRKQRFPVFSDYQWMVINGQLPINTDPVTVCLLKIGCHMTVG